MQLERAAQRMSKPPPPPPPPPPPRKSPATPRPQVARATQPKGRFRLLAGTALLGAGAVYALKQRADEKRKAEPDAGKADDAVRQYLRVQAEQNADLEAKAVLSSKQTEDAKPQQHEFRLDVSRDGLVKTLSFLLETKRMEEQELIKKVRRGVYPVNYENDLRRMKKEKREMKDLIKGLKPA